MKKIKTQLKRLSKHECYRAIKGNNIKLWIWYKYHMAEMKCFQCTFQLQLVVWTITLRCHCVSYPLSNNNSISEIMLKPDRFSCSQKIWLKRDPPVQGRRFSLYNLSFKPVS